MAYLDYLSGAVQILIRRKWRHEHFKIKKRKDPRSNRFNDNTVRHWRQTTKQKHIRVWLLCKQVRVIRSLLRTVWPVIHEASFEAKNATMLAMSSGVPSRPSAEAAAH